VLWNFASIPGVSCSAVGRSTVDENGVLRIHPFAELSAWANEMAHDLVNNPAPIRVVQFGTQIAFLDMVRGTIRLAEEPPFPCVDPTLPCPPDAECAETRCSELPN
jgi:hypothetical protein